MNHKAKRWPILVNDVNHDWAKETSKETRVSIADIVAKMFDNAMNDAGFVKSLGRERWKLEMQKLQDQKLAIEEKEKELARYIKGEKVPA